MAGLSMGRVALVVRDIDKVGAWYEQAVGLHLLRRDGETAWYGAGDTVLLELRRDTAARMRDRNEAGLFHTAFLLPDRASLGQWVADAAARQTRVDGAADHLVSETLYLTDPEGNGVEIYADRPREAWTRRGIEVQMASDPLDIPALVASAAGREAWQGVPDGTVIGHVHLQAGAIPDADAFYSGVLGLDLTARYPGASFYAADGYHHHLGANIWNSRGAAPRSFPSTGLAEVEIRLDATRAAAIRDRATVATVGDRLILTDPWNTPISLVTVG
ncbi:catechol 2,3-dioxygenase [Gemmobacter megaterium]|uniref:Catechol 2,3-dioxygenase n=1 Tax=Gemmobacter megaterium TaxID=1086013 RepID=A0A1N7M808_9RHOB|nr:VOC family protein [Gemmobacter megaterium]GGE08332.1 glyoxalase [Gemmobacter megaterium]SIS82204.1 catechol 2,3-dioxygenase [Gemmobacter megaterium]